MKTEDEVISLDGLKLYFLGVFILLGLALKLESVGIWVSLFSAVMISILLWFTSFETEGLLTRKQSLGVVSVLMIAGLILRIEDLGSSSLWYDEAISSIAVDSIIETGKPVLESGKVYLRGIPHLLLGALSSWILGVSDFALRLPSALTGTLTIPLTFLLGKELFDRETGLIAAALIAFSTWQIVWSRQVRMYSLLQLLYLMSILMIYRTEKNLKPRNILLLSISIILAGMTHVTAYILPLIALAYFFWTRYGGMNSRDMAKIILPVALASVIVQNIYFSYQNLIGRLTFSPENISTYLNWLGSNTPLILILGIAGILPSIKKNRKGSFLMLLSTVPIAYIYSLHVDTAASRYLYVLMPFLSIWSGFLLAKILRSPEIEKSFYKIVLAVLFLSVVFSGSFASGDYEPGLSAPQPDFESAYTYVQDRRETDDLVVSGWTPPAVHYLEESPDFTLVGQYFEIPEREFNGSEQYSGAKFIRNGKELKAVMRNNPRGWIILDERAWRGQRPGVKTILEDISLEKQFYEIKVWSWRNTSEINQ